MNLRAKWAALAAIILALVVLGSAEPVSQLKPTGYVNDFAHVLNPTIVAQITDLAQQVDDKAHAQIALVTINSLDGRDIESYSVELFKQWGIGSKKTDHGVLILYAIQDHRARIEVGYGLEPILPDGKVGGFQREAIPLMRSGDYNSALLLVTSRVAETIAADAGVQLTNVQVRAPAPVDRQEHGISLGGILLFILVVIVVLATPLRSILFLMLFSGMGGGRGGGDWGGGGGFGGGGGGFGGFGGGSSGGGGASSGW